MIPPNSSDPAWLREAKRDLGIREGRDDAAILRYRQYTKERPWAGTSGSGSSWCSDAMCAWFERAGIASTRSAGAASWKRWGQPCRPQVGAVVVFGPHDTDAGGTGHVALVVEVQGDHLSVIGGNQGNAVSIRRRSVSDAVAFRWPLVP